MFQIDFDGASAGARKAKFHTFEEAMGCATTQARLARETVFVRYPNGTLVAWAAPQADGSVSLNAICEGRPMLEALVEQWAR